MFRLSGVPTPVPSFPIPPLRSGVIGSAPGSRCHSQTEGQGREAPADQFLHQVAATMLSEILHPLAGHPARFLLAQLDVGIPHMVDARALAVW